MTAQQKISHDVIDPVQWHEGMLLGPHHFQQNDLRVQQLLNYHLQKIAPYFWGVVSITIDPVFLLQGVMRFQKLDMIMPDGSLVLKPEDDAFPDINLADFHAQLLRRPMILYGAIAAHRHGVGNACGPAARYESRVGRAVVDDNTGDNPIVLPRWRPKIHFILGERPSERYVSMPVAEVMIRDNAYVLTPYVPPIVTLDAAPVLGDLCRDIFRIIREKMIFLLGPFKDMQQTALPADTIRNLEILSMGLVPCETLFYSGIDIHPFVMYQSICQLAGHLSALRCTSLPPIFPPYDHHNILRSFQKVADYIKGLLKTVEDQYESLSFSINADGNFELAPHPAFATKRLVIGLRTSSTRQDADTAAWIQNAVIVRQSQKQIAQERRILGARRRLIERDDVVQISAGKGLILCEVQDDGAFISATEPLLIFNLADHAQERPQDIIMYVAKSANEG